LVQLTPSSRHRRASLGPQWTATAPEWAHSGAVAVHCARGRAVAPHQGTPPVLMHGDRDDRPFVLLTKQLPLGASAGAPHPPQSLTGRVLVQPPSPTGRRSDSLRPRRAPHIRSDSHVRRELPLPFVACRRRSPPRPCPPRTYYPLSIMSTNVVWHEGLSKFITASMLCLLLFEFRRMDRTPVAAMRRCSPACVGM